MPSKPLKPCSRTGCPALTTGGYCEKHRRQERKQYDSSRGTAAERGYDIEWQKLRDHKAELNPLCELHLKQGKVIPLDVVHHIKPIETNPELRLVLDNLQSLCTQCHEEIHKDGRWGR